MTELQGLGSCTPLHGMGTEGRKEYGVGPEGMESCFSNTLLMAVVLERWDGPNSRRRARSAQTGAGALGACISSKFPAASPETTARSCLGLCRLKCTQHRPKDYRGSREHASLLLIVQSCWFHLPPDTGGLRVEAPAQSPLPQSWPLLPAPWGCTKRPLGSPNCCLPLNAQPLALS